MKNNCMYEEPWKKCLQKEIDSKESWKSAFKGNRLKKESVEN